MENDIREFLLEPKPIKVGKLCLKNFNLKIPSYQRGYRWTKRRYYDLLRMYSFMMRRRMVLSIVFNLL